MSSVFLIDFVSGLGDESRFREARDRTYIIDGERVVDWPKDRAIQAFLARELATARWSAGLTSDPNPPNLEHLLSPLDKALLKQRRAEQAQEDQQIHQRRQSQLARLYKNVEGGVPQQHAAQH